MAEPTGTAPKSLAHTQVGLLILQAPYCICCVLLACCMGSAGPCVLALLQQGAMGTDNPMNSQQTLKFRRSYRALAVAAGFRMVSAVPLKLTEQVTTLRHLVVALDTGARLLYHAIPTRDSVPCRVYYGRPSCMGLRWGQQGIHELDSELHGAEVGALQLGLLLPDAIDFFQAICMLLSEQMCVTKWCLPCRGMPPYGSASYVDFDKSAKHACSHHT